MTATEPILDSEAYAAGIAAYAHPGFVRCPYELGSRPAQCWYDGRADAERMAEVDEE